MNLNGGIYFLHNPSADTIEAGLEAGELIINTDNGPIMVFGQSNISSCNIICAQPCVPQQYEITFGSVDFGTCSPCPANVGFRVVIRRPDFGDNATWPNWLSEKVYEYPATTGTVNAATQATYFANLINNSVLAWQHDDFGMTASANAGVLTLTVACPYKVDIYPLDNRGTAAAPTIAETVAGQDANWTIEQVQALWNRFIESVPGTDHDPSYFSNCESVCVISMKGCYTGCATTTLHKDNFVPLVGQAQGVPQDFIIVVNSNAPGYGAFITELASTFTACASLTPVAGSSTPFLSAVPADWAGGLDTVEAGFTYPSNYKISKIVAATGATLSGVVIGATSLSDLATKATALLGVTFTAAAPDLTIAGAFATGALVITVQKV